MYRLTYCIMQMRLAAFCPTLVQIPPSKSIAHTCIGLSELDYCTVVYSIMSSYGIYAVWKTNWRCPSWLCLCTQAAGSAKNNVARWCVCVPCVWRQTYLNRKSIERWLKYIKMKAFYWVGVKGCYYTSSSPQITREKFLCSLNWHKSILKQFNENVWPTCTV